MESHHKESGVHQVKDSMFNSADVLVYVHPVICLLFVKRLLCVLVVAISQEVPG